MPDSLRLFVAVSLPQDLKAYLVQERLAYADPAVRLVPEQNLHLTLYFIGNVAPEQKSSIKDTLAKVAGEHKPFTLVLEQLEPGPKPRSPRLVWARFKQNKSFSDLSRALSNLLATHPAKHDKFIPHVTLVRFRKNLPAPTNLPFVKPGQEINFPVTSLALWKSTLNSPHPEYEMIQEFSLKESI